MKDNFNGIDVCFSHAMMKCPQSRKCTECENKVFYHTLTCVKRKSNIDQIGLFATETIQANQFIIEYTGKVFSSTTKKIGKYCLEMGNIVIDAELSDSPCRFVNHSCVPNCCLSKWVELPDKGNEIERISVQSLSVIKAGEEITVNYGEQRHLFFETCKCFLCVGGGN